MGSIEVINIHQNIPNDGVYIYIGRNKENNVLGNPYTHVKNNGTFFEVYPTTLAKYIVSDRDASIEHYKTYFEEMYQNNAEFKQRIDEIYDMYSRGAKIYLGCFCAPKSCHGDIIKKYIEMKYLNLFIK